MLSSLVSCCRKNKRKCVGAKDTNQEAKMVKDTSVEITIHRKEIAGAFSNGKGFLLIFDVHAYWSIFDESA